MIVALFFFLSTQNLTNILVDLHHEFYRRDKSSNGDASIGKLPLDNAMKEPEPQKVASVIKSHRKQVRICIVIQITM